MFLKNRRRRRTMAEINVVPYIDVMLVLLIIFMVTTPLLTEGVKIDLPEADAKPLAENQQPIIVTVDAKGQYYLNLAETPSKPLSPVILANRVAVELKSSASNKPRAVLVKGDKKVAYDRVVRAMVLLQQAGAQQVGLVTEDLPTST